jgi:antirestriction protein
MTITVAVGAEHAEYRIYVACLAAYNSGRMHGAWIDATQDETGIQDDIHSMLLASPEPGAEEWAIHDYDGFGDLGRALGEWADFETISKVANLLEEHGAAYGEYAAHMGSNEWPDGDDFEEAFLGKWDSEQAYAESYVDDSGMLSEMPENLRMYFDYDGFARDLFMGDYWTADAPGGVFVFQSI